MKKLGLLAISLSVLASATSFGIYDPTWERPVQRAGLNEAFTHEAFEYPVASELTLHKRDGQRKATVFSLTEDTGIRCVMAPCPSFKTSLFQIVGVRRVDRLRVEYKAVELPRVEDNGKIVNGGRSLDVVDFAGFQQQWNVRVRGIEGRSRNYVGYPEAVVTIQSLEAGE
ncbi:MAG: hypothetical protein H6617_07320 [Bdellovibrionaceae bacterium]|nr:hypothetical protein [Pseudobdellovibrionaceae bacterium]